jgi:hypothetical protein
VVVAPELSGSIETSNYYKSNSVALERLLIKACDPNITESDSSKYFEQYLTVYCEKVLNNYLSFLGI